MRKIPLFLILLAVMACSTSQDVTLTPPPSTAVPLAHEARWGIYRLDLRSEATELIFSTPKHIASLNLNHAGSRFAFSQKVGGDADADEEIFTLTSDGRNLQQLTHNEFYDLYPVWSPDDSQIAFLSRRQGSLGIYLMQADGSRTRAILDSPANEADIDWQDDRIAFTRDNRIWLMHPDGSDAHPLTTPPRAGEWGAANLPFGDYDPRLSPKGDKVVFERLVDDASPHGNYDFFLFDLNTNEEIRLTQSGYTQGLASWSHSGRQFAYIVAAIGQAGQYDLYLMDIDDLQSRNITPAYFPSNFLVHCAVFSNDDASIFFIGEWWSADE